MSLLTIRQTSKRGGQQMLLTDESHEKVEKIQGEIPLSILHENLFFVWSLRPNLKEMREKQESVTNTDHRGPNK